MFSYVLNKILLFLNVMTVKRPNQFYKYLTDTEQLLQDQFGFLKYRSTQKKRHKLMESVYSNIQDGKIVDMLDLDLRKAFDTANHKIILQKLQYQWNL